jgi:hypothetical protein
MGKHGKTMWFNWEKWYIFMIWSIFKKWTNWRDLIMKLAILPRRWGFGTQKSWFQWT